MRCKEQNSNCQVGQRDLNSLSFHSHFFLFFLSLSLLPFRIIQFIISIQIYVLLLKIFLLPQFYHISIFSVIKIINLRLCSNSNLSFCLCLYFSLSIFLSVSFSLYLSLTLFLSFCLSLSTPLFLTLYICLYLLSFFFLSF